MDDLTQNVVDERAASEKADGPKDDVWVPSSCSLCYASCSIRAHRVNGTIVKIEGNPDSALGKGRLCGKGVSGIMTHYDPNRVNKPLRRTNPEKGIGIDPQWEEISWDEALDTVAEKLKKIREDDPRKLYFMRTTTVMTQHVPPFVFTSAFGTPNSSAAGGGLHCGNGAHLISGVMHASWSIVPDFQYCNYAVYFGASKGHAAGHASCSNMTMAADARVRGMKMVVVDPFANQGGASATEWVPIRVGTDAGLALAMANVLVNELEAYDIPYLKAKTNMPYLIDDDQRYVRDPETGKPLIWDSDQDAAVPFNAADAAAMALEGNYTVDGKPCRPAFVLMKRHLQSYPVERGEEITTISAATIRRLATEFAEQARIGSTIVIDGITVPYRPVAAIAFRGSQGHKNSTYNMFAVDLLNHLVGAADVAGGCLGFNPACDGFPETGRLKYVPHPDPDGMMITGSWMGMHEPFPINDPRSPERVGLQDLFPMGMGSVFQASTDQEEMWNRFDFDYRPEMMINLGANQIMSVGNSEAVEASLKKFKFILSFDIFLTETSEFADIVLPDCGYLETVDSRSNFPFIFSLPAGLGDWCWPVRQRVVEPEGERRLFADVLLELGERIGITPDMNAAYNAFLELEDEQRLKLDRTYTFEEICDHDLKDKFGPDKGFEYFKEHGLVKWPKKPKEVYWRAFVDVRVPLYWEWMPDTWEKAMAITAPKGLDIPKEYYSPLPDWLPCPSHECEAEEFDFYAFYYRDVIHTNSFTMENPWLDEAARLDPFSYNIAINADVGRDKGLKSGDYIRVENEYGHKVEGRVRLTEAIHPEGLGIGACAGHWARNLPIAKGKGVFFNDLVELDWHHSSPSNLTLDLCAKVKITKAEAAE
ncbi:MAG: molybdopterin-binding protein [Rhodospirillaceae bacterium]|jgi:molybdopterin-containing oxidoreductase family molybdopterin binding subunit|nr:molybdopterin-binding protein [Rhodospirillaceae bacterium]MDP6644882.1 molybdopterin-dependent oxidoreductase [Rhodospirillales bacterium]